MKRTEAWVMLTKYNQDHFHLQHALTVEAVMRWYAEKLGYGGEADFWATVGLLHDLDFEQFPEQHCVKSQELMRKAGVDEATIHAEVSDAEPYTIERLVWDGHGCSISQASLSVMVDLVEGKTVDEAMKLAETFHKLMESRGKGLNDEQAEESLEDGIVFQGVSQYPMRIKCALLGWEGMKDAVAKALAAKA